MSSGTSKPLALYCLYPSIIQLSMPDASSLSLEPSFLSSCASVKLSLNGIMLIRRQMPVSVPLIFGLWLVAKNILKVGVNSKNSLFKNLAVIGRDVITML